MLVGPPGVGIRRRFTNVLHATVFDYSAASASAALRVGCTSSESTMSPAFRPAVTAKAITEMSSAAWRPTIEPPSTTPVAGSDRIFTKPRGSLLIRALALAANGTLVTRILRPRAKASASARPTSAISGSVRWGQGGVALCWQRAVGAVNGHAVAGPRYADGPCALQQDDTAPKEVVLQGGGHLGVLEGQDLLTADDQGDLGAERREHVDELDTRD